jgi:hypothetical protein
MWSEFGWAGAPAALLRGGALDAVRARSGALMAVLVSLAALALGAAMPADVWAAGPEFLVQFGDTGAGAGETTNPRGVATDVATGHVYVADLGNRRIDEFTPWGGFVKAFGWGVADGTTEALQSCTSTCFKGLNGAGAGELNNPLGVAVDSVGDVYVVDFSNHRVQKFDSSGNFLLMFGGGVNATKVEEAEEGKTISEAEENVCTKTQLEGGDTCGAGTIGTGHGQFGAWRVGSFIAVGPAGTVYVGDIDRIEEFESNGIYKSEIARPGDGAIESLATDSSGNLYAVAQNAPGVRELDSSGAVLDTVDSGGAPRALATDSSGNVYVVDGSSNPDVLKFSSTGVQTASFAAGELIASMGIGTNAIGDVYVSNFTSTDSYVRAYGPLPTTFEPPPSARPTVGAEFAASVSASSAIVKAEINPHFFATTYYVQYGASDCSTSACDEQPASPGLPLGSERDRSVLTGGLSLDNLTPGAVYHYRFVAVSEAGTSFGSDRTFKTYPSGMFALPDARAFELVSPLDKNTGEVEVPGEEGGLVDVSGVKPLQASPAGEALTYTSFTAFGDAQSAPAASQYLSRRSAAGWSTEDVSPADQEGYTQNPLRGFSPDLSFGAVVQREPTLAAGAVAGYENLYLRNNESGSLRALTTATPTVSESEAYCVGYAGASANFDRVIFLANGALANTRAPEGHGFSLYEWSQASGLSLVSVLPGGTPAQPSSNAGFGGEGFGCDMNESLVRHAISADGSRIFWTYHPSEGASELLARENGTSTVQLDAPQGGGRFLAASADGSKVLFADEQPLTADAPAGSGNSLYQYDLDTGGLTDLTPVPEGQIAEVQGLLGASEDGSYVYFVATGALSAGATLGQDNLYVQHAGEAPRFIATLSKTETRAFPEGDAGDWSAKPRDQTARVTPDGRYLAFESINSLKAINYPQGYENIDQSTGEPDSEVYLYDVESASLVCASCNPSGARPIGPASLPAWSTPYEQPRYLSNDGGLLFFDSSDALALHDTNGKQDVYEFELQGLGSCAPSNVAFNASAGGCLFPLSPGTSGDNSYFLDASTDGSDVFVATRQGLVPQDEDERFDVYDARVDGGFPAPPSSPPACVGETCRLALSPAPVFGASASLTLSGAGNLAPPASTPVVSAKTTNAKPLTRAQKLANALKACKRKPKKRRAACSKQARKRYRGRSKGKRSDGRVGR